MPANDASELNGDRAIDPLALDIPFCSGFTIVKPETVDHPAHYHPGTYEAINVIEAWELGFCLGNTIKYISRAGHKANRLEDLKKAMWYLEREIARTETE